MKRLVCLALLATILGCGSRPGRHSTMPGAASTTVPGATAPAPSPPSPQPLPDPTPMELAKLHAPLYRFNGWVPNDRSLQNRNEDLFPMGAARFFDELESRTARVVVAGSAGPTPSMNKLRVFSQAASVDSAALNHAPKQMAGDEPGTAPVYVHVWEDASRRVQNADGSGEEVFFIEYWVFYPQDEARIQIWWLSGIAFPIGGHRADWEGTTFQVAKVRGAGGAFLRSEVRRGYYNAHLGRTSVEPGELTLTDDQGAAGPGGTHPAVFVSVGKHASYPEAGRAYDMLQTAPFVDFDEFFLGNGVAWRSWASPLHDLEGPATAEFTPASFKALVAPGVALTDWRDFQGRWGGDKIFGKGVSPRAPRFHSKWGAGDKATGAWSKARTGWGMKLGGAPAIVPPPAPIRS